jgi:REP element-mobilizing transposase RayT
MPYVSIWIHCVWGTISRVPFMIQEKKHEIISHIRANTSTKGICIDFLNGFAEHLHCLLKLESDQKLSWVIQMIKGESSAWISRIKLINDKFEWADEYYAASVSKSHIDIVREYIKNKEDHNRIKPWDEERDEFLKSNTYSGYSG